MWVWKNLYICELILKYLFMSRLSDLYKAMETLRREGLALNEDLEKQVSELEEEIIKKEILPVVTETIAPALKQVQRELVLVVDYLPGAPISVHLSRKRNFTQQFIDAKEIVLDPEVQHSKKNIKKKIGLTHGPATRLIIEFPDGTIISEKSAVETMKVAVLRIGVAKVRKAVEEHNLRLSKAPVVSNRRDEKYASAQKDLGGGWLLMTHSSNLDKKKFFDKLSKILNLGLKVEVKL